MFPKFIKYFEYNYFIRSSLKELDWSFDIKKTLNSYNINEYFYTNNICESQILL